MNHWCKSAIDEIIPAQNVESLCDTSMKQFPPPPLPPRIGQNIPPTAPAHLQYYPAFTGSHDATYVPWSNS